jgi:hypothetical protein
LLQDEWAEKILNRNRLISGYRFDAVQIDRLGGSAAEGE